MLAGLFCSGADQFFGDDCPVAVEGSIESQIESLTSQRDALAMQIRDALNAAAFDGQALDEQQAKDWIKQAQSLIDQAAALAAANS